MQQSLPHPRSSMRLWSASMLYLNDNWDNSNNLHKGKTRCSIPSMQRVIFNAASRYHDSPVKQRAVHKDSNSGRSRPLYHESKPPPPGGWYAKAPERSAFPRHYNNDCWHSYLVHSFITALIDLNISEGCTNAISFAFVLGNGLNINNFKELLQLFRVVDTSVWTNDVLKHEYNLS